jgi:hypothetical protein
MFCLVVHLTIMFASIGNNKPWKNDHSSLFETAQLSWESINPIDYTEQWYCLLKNIELQTGTKLNFDFTKGGDKGAPVGKSPFYRQMITHIQAKASRNWTAYAVRD